MGLVLTSTFVATHLIYAWADAFLYRPITMQRSNFPLSYPMTARTFWKNKGFINAETYSQRLEQEGRLDALKLIIEKDLQFEQVENKPNILVITVSGLRYDALTSEKCLNCLSLPQVLLNLRIITVAAIRIMPA